MDTSRAATPATTGASWGEAAADAPQGGINGAVVAVRDRIRAAIMSGELPPGTVMSQLGLSQRLGVSRTPLREALRMLQEEGLVEIERNRRAKVASFDAEDLEVVYASRILLTALATTLTVPRLTENEIIVMEQLVERMKQCSQSDDHEGWRTADHAFHRTHCQFAPASMQRELRTLFERATLYRLLRLRDQPHRQAITFSDHEAIISACRERNARAAVDAVVRHLSRIALALLAYTAPERDPQTIRAALQIVLGAGAPA